MLLPYVKFFKKQKRGLELVFLRYFLHAFWRKIFRTLYFINWLNSIAWLSLLFEILGDTCTVIICCLVCGVIKFEINHCVLTMPFFYLTKSQHKNVKILRTKRGFTKKYKAFFIILKGVSIDRWWWWWWWWWQWIVFVVWLTDERHLALFPAGTIVRDPPHRESPTRREQGLNLRRTWVQA